MLKKNLMIFALLVLAILVFLGCYYFWPRYIFTVYGYHDIENTSDHGEWSITVGTSSEVCNIDFSKWWNRVDPYSKKINIYGSPYQLSMGHAPHLKIDKLEIKNSGNIVFASDDFERITNEWSDGSKHCLTTCQGVEIDYGDYDLVIYYSLEDQGELIIGTIEEKLETDFTEKKISLFETGLGI